MTLTPRKLAHMQTNVARTFTGRSQPVILTLRTEDGGTTTLQVNAVFRAMGDFDPTLEGAVNDRMHVGAAQDAFAIFNATDVTLTQLRATISLTFPSPVPSNQPAQRYTLLDVEPVGILVGFTRFFTKWSRQN